MYQDLSLNNKIKWAKHNIECCEKTVAFWKEKESILKEKYNGRMDKISMRHIHDVKEYGKKAKSELLYWENEYNTLRGKQEMYNLFQ